MQIDAIVSDLDDTLLNEDAELSPFTLDVLSRAAARGVRIIPASGRAARSMLPYARQLNTGVPYIACNGSQLVAADHTVLETYTLSAQRAREIIRYVRTHGFFVQSYRDDDFYYDAECEASVSYKRSSGMNGHAVGDLETFTTFPVPKLLCVQEPAQVEALYPLISREFPDVTFTISKPYFLEAQPQGVSKGEALRKLAPRLMLTPAHTLVFGDSLNDISMLKFAEHSVAMGNARDEVKAAAQYVCQTNAEDGVARFVLAHVLT